MTPPFRRVVLLGLDGFDPGLVRRMRARGDLPNLGRLAARGGAVPIRTTTPAQTPVAWSTVATGANPGVHGIFDFVTRDPATCAPDAALFGFERRGAFLPPRLVNRRRGTPMWTFLNRAGIPTTVLRFPGTYPPDPVDGRMLSGVGVPDIRGGFGTSVVFSGGSVAAAGENEEVHPLELRGPEWHGELPGPRLPGGARATVPFRLRSEGGGLIAEFQGSPPAPLPVRGWSAWVPVRFRLGALQSVRGQLRLYLTAGAPDPVLYASPVHFDPLEPPHPISHPWEYAGDLALDLGRFHTLGMSEEHQGMNNGRLGPGAFLDQCRTVMTERATLLSRELARNRHGLVACVFDTPDRLQHMFWRFRDEEADHPANRALGRDRAWSAVVEDHYRECDALVGEVADALEDADLLLVLSDHGFGTFRREVHLNTILHDAGLLHLRGGASPGDEAAEVDWDRTRAYAVGLAGIYLNRRGREANGIVADHEVPDLTLRITRTLESVPGPEGGPAPIRRIQPREKVYRGPAAGEAPDILVGCAGGFRVSSRTALGGFGAAAVTPNLRGWAGDHVVDPELVPGILVSSAPLAPGEPDLRDVAPTVLAALGAPAAAEMEGGCLL